MKLKKLFETLKQCRGQRKEYRIEPHIKFAADTHHYAFFLLPTIFIQPWPYRHPNWSVVEFYWLNFRISYGIWRCKENA